MAGHRGAASGGYPSQCEQRAKIRAINAERRALDSVGASPLSRGMANRGAHSEPGPRTPGAATTPRGVYRTNSAARPASTNLSATMPARTSKVENGVSDPRTPFNWPVGRQGMQVRRHSNPSISGSPGSPPLAVPRSPQQSSRASNPRPVSKMSWAAGPQRIQREGQVESARAASVQKSTNGSNMHSSNGTVFAAEPARRLDFENRLASAQVGQNGNLDSEGDVTLDVTFDSDSSVADNGAMRNSRGHVERYGPRDNEPRPRPSPSSGSSVPCRFRRFTEAQREAYPRALEEIKNGRKSSCWMWFIIPTPPYVVNGVEKGSSQNRKYALRSDDEARAYLAYEADGVNLRSNYLEIMCAVREQLRTGKKAVSLMGTLDEPKLRSSASLFERVTRDGFDEAIHSVVQEVIDLLRVQGSR